MMPKCTRSTDTCCALLHSNPAAAEFYDNEVQKSFSDHTERAKLAKKSVLRHLGVHKAVPTLPTPAASPMAQRGSGDGGGGGGAVGGGGSENVFAKKAQQRPGPIKLPNGSAEDLLSILPSPPFSDLTSDYTHFWSPNACYGSISREIK
jgi:hypothetical protein